uniref:Nudix hydrolase domain-containing protein n=1 Tax=Cyanoderma ruficeps TaxID=181631 RepID=A0A8C3NRT2_9PASS
MAAQRTRTGHAGTHIGHTGTRTGHGGHAQHTGDAELSPLSGDRPRARPVPAARQGARWPARARPRPSGAHAPPGGHAPSRRPRPRHGERARARARGARGGRGGGGVRAGPGGPGMNRGEPGGTGGRWESGDSAAVSPQSVTGLFCPAHTDVALVSCGLQRGHFLISDVPFPGSAVTVLKRPPFCPAKLGGATPGDRGGHPGVAAAVAVLLEAACGHVLLTRRAATLRHFPNVWVPPGECEDGGQELWGLRELAEETGLHLEPGTFSWRLLGLWESLFPPTLTWGPPRCHHIVTYLGLRSAEPRQQLQARLCPSPCEVSAVAWLEPLVLEAIAATEDGAEGSESGSFPGELPPTVGITELSTDGFRSSRIPTGILLRRAPARGPDLERVSTGTKFALGRWRAGPGGRDRE